MIVVVYLVLFPLALCAVVYGLWALHEHAKWEQRRYDEWFAQQYGNRERRIR